MDIRTKTGIIIEKGGEYLVGTILFSTDLRWSASPWDAWITRRKDQALMVAEKVGGRRVLFNPVAGQLRKMGET
jgi:hypothetical protein